MARAEITLSASALQHNLQIVQNHAPKSQVMVAVKADGYGHGIEWVSQTLKDADAFGVATINEANSLIQAGCDKQIVLLEGFIRADDAIVCADEGVACVIHHISQLEMIEGMELSKPLNVWLKIDSGMHRLGIQPHQFEKIYATIINDDRLNLLGIMTHLANADDLKDTTTLKQLERFDSLTTSIALPRSIANSAGILGWPQTHADVVRPGIMIYGASPFITEQRKKDLLKPVMTFRSELISINEFDTGDAIGYGGTWQCTEPTKIGVVAVGYGDGYPRHAPSGTPVLIHGKRVPLVGRVSMDMITIDLRTLPKAKIGDEVILWGEGLPAEEVADVVGTISYELFCRMTNRVTIKYID